MLRRSNAFGGGREESTRNGLVAPRSRANFSDFSLPMILYKLPSHCMVVVCWVGSGMTNFPLYFGIQEIFERLRRVRGFHLPLVVDDADRCVAINRTEVGSITSLGNALADGERYLAKRPSFFITKSRRCCSP